MKKKDLEIRLQRVRNFIDPDSSLEQYMTPSVIASDILFTAYSEGDINGMDVIDLGCGTGMFTIGAWMLGATSAKGFDISGKAVTVARENAAAFGADLEFTECDISDVTMRGDTALMNPPFGCQKRRADRAFLDKAMELCGCVYTMHMSSTAEFLNDYVNAAGREICLQRRYRFNIPHTFSFHSKTEQSIDIVMLMIR